MTIRLKKKEERRILRGHPWVFSNEIEERPADAQPGAIVDVLDHNGKFIGRGYYNPHSLIAARILTRKKEPIDQSFFLNRIADAASLRQRMGLARSFRAVYSEGDYIPGLIVDKYEDVLVVQSLTAGIERLLNTVIDALDKVYQPTTVILKNDSPARSLEGLRLETRIVKGAVSGPVRIEESGLYYHIDLLGGQKTGFFFDQRENRQALRGLVDGKKTLDCFCYVGAWALNAKRFGASEVIGIDSSERAIALARENAALNSLSVEFETADVFDELKSLEKEKKSFGCIILDPPAFVKSRSKIREAIKGYKEINLRAMRLLEDSGLLVTCSCSYHIDEDLFKEMLIDAAYSAGRHARIIEMRSQAKDHPVALACRESRYLKCAFLIVD